MTDPKDLPALIARVRGNAVVLCDKCRVHGAGNDVVVCRNPGNCHDIADHSHAALSLATALEEQMAEVERLKAALSANLESAKDGYMLGGAAARAALVTVVENARDALEGGKP